MEAVAILPQLYMVNKTGRISSLIGTYLSCLVLYKIFYIFNWIHRSRYDINFINLSTSFFSAIVQSVMYLYLVYLYFTAGKMSMVG